MNLFDSLHTGRVWNLKRTLWLNTNRMSDPFDALLLNSSSKKNMDTLSIISSRSARSERSARSSHQKVDLRDKVEKYDTHQRYDDTTEPKDNTREAWMSDDDDARSIDSWRSKKVREVREERVRDERVREERVREEPKRYESPSECSVRSVARSQKSIPRSEKSEKRESTDVKSDEYWTRRPKSDGEALMMKREILFEFERLRSKGYRLPHGPAMYSMETSLEEMQHEYVRIRKNKELDAGVMFQRNMMMTCVSGIEFLTTNFSPIDCKLEGWSHKVSDDIDSYDDIFEELYVKYRGQSNMGPEMRLLMCLAGSAVMFSAQNRISRMAEQMMGLGPQSQQQQQKPGLNMGAMLGSLSSMFGNVFGNMSQQPQEQGGMRGPQAQQQAPHQAPQQTQQQTQQQAPQQGGMRGPSRPQNSMREMNVDNVIRNLQENAFHNGADLNRVDIISNISESDIPDDDSVLSGNLIQIKSKSKGTRRTLDLSDMI